MPIEVADIIRLPKYLRFEPVGDDDNWNVSFAAALAYTPQFAVAYYAPGDFRYLWMSNSSGKVLHLTEEFISEPQIRIAKAKLQAAIEANR